MIIPANFARKLERERNEARAALEAEKKDHENDLREEEGVEGRCQRGHHKKFTYQLNGVNGCMVCQCDELRAALEAERKKQWCPHMTDPDGSKINCGEYIGREIKAREAAEAALEAVQQSRRDLWTKYEAAEARVRELEGK